MASKCQILTLTGWRWPVWVPTVTTHFTWTPWWTHDLTGSLSNSQMNVWVGRATAHSSIHLPLTVSLPCACVRLREQQQQSIVQSIKTLLWRQKYYKIHYWYIVTVTFNFKKLIHFVIDVCHEDLLSSIKFLKIYISITYENIIDPCDKKQYQCFLKCSLFWQSFCCLTVKLPPN